MAGAAGARSLRRRDQSRCAGAAPCRALPVRSADRAGGGKAASAPAHQRRPPDGGGRTSVDRRRDHFDPGTLDGIGPLKRSFQPVQQRSEEHTSELQSLMRISYAVFCLKKKKSKTKINNTQV